MEDLTSFCQYGNVADVLIRSGINQTIDQIEYETNEPYTLLKNTQLQYSYSSILSNVSSKGNLINNQFQYPDQIVIKNVVLTEKILKLLYTTYDNTNAQYKNFFKTDIINILSDDNGKVALDYYDLKNIFIYKNNQLIKNINLQSTNIIDNLQPSTQYLIIYDYIDTLSISKNYILDLNLIPSYGYFALDIFSTGNLEDVTSNFTLRFSKCTLQTAKVFTFDGLSTNNIDLIFTISKDSNNYMTIGGR